MSEDFFNVEPVLMDMGAFIGMIFHLATSEVQPTTGEWQALAARLQDLHTDLDGRWQAALAALRQERIDHAAGLAAAKAEVAAAEANAGPLSGVALERLNGLRKFMVTIAQMTVDHLATPDAPDAAKLGRPRALRTGDAPMFAEPPDA